MDPRLALTPETQLPPEALDFTYATEPSSTIILYFKWYGVQPETIVKLVDIKQHPELPEAFDEVFQSKLVVQTKGMFAKKDPPWDWNATNIGKYIAQGHTDPSYFMTLVKLTEEEIQKIADRELMDEQHTARKPQVLNTVLDAAMAKLCENMRYAWIFKQRINTQNAVPGSSDSGP